MREYSLDEIEWAIGNCDIAALDEDYQDIYTDALYERFQQYFDKREYDADEGRDVMVLEASVVAKRKLKALRGLTKGEIAGLIQMAFDMGVLFGVAAKDELYD